MTPTDRLTAYQTALAGLDERRYNNVCYYLCDVTQYPEFLKQRPRGKALDKPWWTMTARGMAARRRALIRAIKIIQP